MLMKNDPDRKQILPSIKAESNSPRSLVVGLVPNSIIQSININRFHSSSFSLLSIYTLRTLKLSLCIFTI